MQYTTALVNTKKTALVGLVEMLQLVLMISIYRTKIISIILIYLLPISFILSVLINRK